MTKWIEYTGSDEQINELKTAKNGYMVKGDFAPGDPITGSVVKRYNILIGCMLDVCATHYLICEPHPYADIIKIWADTGCEVWIKPHKPYSFKISDYENNPYAKLLVNEAGLIIVTTKPDWNMNAEYRLTPFEST